MARLPRIEGVGATAAPGAIVVFDWTATAERRPSPELVEPLRRRNPLSLVEKNTCPACLGVPPEKSLTGAQAHSWRGFQGCRTSFAAVKNRDRPFQRWEHGGAAHVVLRHAGRSGVKAARQLPAHCRDELKYSPPAVRVRTQPGLRVEKYRGEDENREERARHEATKRGSRFAEPGSPRSRAVSGKPFSFRRHHYSPTYCRTQNIQVSAFS